MKTTYIRARVSDQEKILVENKAKEFNMTVSDYIRYCCLVKPPKKEIRKVK